MLMKPTSISIFLWLPLVAAAEPVARPSRPMSEPITHQELVQKKALAVQDGSLAKVEVVEGPDPSKINPPKDLLSESDMICFAGYATLVPKRAIIHVPPNFEGRIKMEAGHKIQSWADFYAANRGWITAVEVTRVQAEGNVELPEPQQKQIGKSLNLVIATLAGGPISMLPPKAPIKPPTDTPQP